MSGRQPLSVIEVREPCHESWERMQGGDRARFCDRCQRHVHDLSAMPTDEAERLICESAGNLCVRFDQAADGSVVTLDYQPKPTSKRAWRNWIIIGGCIAAIAGIADAVGIFRKAPTPPPQRMMGVMCVPTPPITPPSTANGQHN